jgi:hypothetical protein
MSSFKKASKGNAVESTSRIQGVKPWINGQYLVSCGNRELDTILGGGLALGTSYTIIEDLLSSFGETLLYYSIAESLSQGHRTLIVCKDPEDASRILSNLPYNMNNKLNQPIIPENEDQNLKQHLKIAWQYGKYLSDGTSNKYDNNMFI